MGKNRTVLFLYYFNIDAQRLILFQIKYYLSCVFRILNNFIQLNTIIIIFHKIFISITNQNLVQPVIYVNLKLFNQRNQPPTGVVSRVENLTSIIFKEHNLIKILGREFSRKFEITIKKNGS